MPIKKMRFEIKACHYLLSTLLVHLIQARPGDNCVVGIRHLIWGKGVRHQTNMESWLLVAALCCCPASLSSMATTRAHGKPVRSVETLYPANSGDNPRHNLNYTS